MKTNLKITFNEEGITEFHEIENLLASDIEIIWYSQSNSNYDVLLDADEVDEDIEKTFIKTVVAVWYSQWDYQEFQFQFHDKDKDQPEVKALDWLRTYFTRTLVYWNFEITKIKEDEDWEWKQSHLLDSYWVELDKAFFEWNKELDYIDDILEMNWIKKWDIDEVEIDNEIKYN